MFNAYEQADDSTSRHYGGTGLGLSISKTLVEMMGGSIEVMSQLGKGTTFHFTVLFRSVTHSDNVSASSIGQAKDNTYSELSSKRILLVEDNIVNQRVAQGLLKRKKVEVKIANNGQEALKEIEENLHDLDAVLMDIEMPVLDGIEATKKIRALGGRAASIPIIAMTAHAMAGDKENCLAAGMNDHIPKPVNPELLYETLTSYLTYDEFLSK